MRSFSIPSVNVPGRVDYIRVGELADLIPLMDASPSSVIFNRASLDGFDTPQKVKTAIFEGSSRHAALSEKHLAAMEAVLPPATTRHAIVDDVTGAFPNVPAFIAGQPMNMRRRAPRENEGAPITICVDVGLAADVPAPAYLKRGAAVVALIRQIQSRRPVELYASCVTGYGAPLERAAVGYFFRIDTAPLDLARAAFVLGSAAFTRLGVYKANAASGWTGAFAYSQEEPTRPEQGTRICQVAFPDREDIVYIPRARTGDASLTNPVEWLKEQVSRFMGANIEDAE